MSVCQITLGISHAGDTQQIVECPKCARPMRLVGIESHPFAAEVELMTYECRCGNTIAEPELAMVRPIEGVQALWRRKK